MTTPTTRSKHPGRICVVDDTIIHVALLRSILEPRGHTVIPMTSAEEAIAEVLRTPPNVLMVAIHMKEMDGFTLVEELRSHGLSANTRIVFLAGGHGTDDAQRAADLGGSDLIKMPPDSADTIRRVEDLISNAAVEAGPNGPIKPMHQQLLSVLESAWRLSLAEELLAGGTSSAFTAEEILTAATGQVSGKARDRGIHLHVQSLPSVDMSGDRALAVRAWAQVLEAAVVRAEPGSDVVIALGSGPNGVTLNVAFACTSATASRMIQTATAGPSGTLLRVERRKTGGVEIVVEVPRGT